MEGILTGLPELASKEAFETHIRAMRRPDIGVYDPDDVDAWIDGLKRSSTSDRGLG